MEIKNSLSEEPQVGSSDSDSTVYEDNDHDVKLVECEDANFELSKDIATRVNCVKDGEEGWTPVIR